MTAVRFVVRACACVAIGAMSLARPALAQSPNLDFGINDDASYAQFLGAIAATEYVRYYYVNDQKPRVVATVAAMLEFATRNPLADQSTLTSFVQAQTAALSTAFAGDPDLTRGARFLPAVRFRAPLTGETALAGFDTDVGERVLQWLGSEVPAPLDFLSLRSRMVEFDLARMGNFSDSPEWANLLVIGFMGRDLNGATRPEITLVLTSFLVSEGYDPNTQPPLPVPAPASWFDDVFAQLPQTYADYLTAIAIPMGQTAPLVWSNIESGFDAIRIEAAASLALLQSAMPDELSLIDSIENGQNPMMVDQVEATIRVRRDELAASRAAISAYALLMYQNADPHVRDLSNWSRNLSESSLGTINWFQLGYGGVLIFASGATITAGIATAGTGAGVGLIAAGIVFGVQGLYNIIEGVGPSPEERAIFDEIVAVRDDIETMRVQMNQRFDRIEMQLNFVFTEIALGLNALGNQIGELSRDVEELTFLMTTANAKLDRIEDALYAMAEALLEADLSSLVATYLNYRPSQGLDLPYAGPAPSFPTGTDGLHNACVVLARNQTYAGPNSSLLTVANAEEMLGSGESIGRHINDLRVFPAQIGLPSLPGGRVVAPGPWAQAAAAYVQLARENRWYFAYQYEQQLLSAGVPEVEQIIQDGQDLASVGVGARSQALFDALFQGYCSALDDAAVIADSRPWVGSFTAEVLEPLSPLNTSARTVSDWEALIEGYATLGMPLAMEIGTILRAGLRADPAVGELSMTGAALAADPLGSTTTGLAQADLFLRVLDLTSPTSPVEIGSIFLPSYQGEVDPYVLYPDPQISSIPVAGVSLQGDSSLEFIDLTDPANPSQLGPIATGMNARTFVVEGLFAYVMATSVDSLGPALAIVEMSDPANPVPRGTWTPSAFIGPGTSIAVQDSLVFLRAQGNPSLTIIDVSDPDNPAQVGSVHAESGSGLGRSIAVSGPIVCTANDVTGMRVIDVSDPANPSPLSSVALPGGGAFGVAVRGRYAYVTGGSPVVLAVVDLLDPSNPITVATPEILPQGFGSGSIVRPSGDYLFVNSFDPIGGDVFVVDISLPNSPVSVGQWNGFGAGTQVDGIALPTAAPVFADMKRRAAFVQDDVDDVLMLPPSGHSYVNWMLAELESLRDDAFELAVDDAYATTVDVPLIVSATVSSGNECVNQYLTGLMANDVDQICRVIEVDTLFSPGDGYVAAANGQVSVQGDGSFTYTPNPGFVGTDTFTYRTGTSVDDPAAASRGQFDLFVYSDPATVLIIVAPPEVCPGDANGSDLVDFNDLNAVLGNWLKSYTPGTGPGDANYDGIVNFADINAVLSNWLKRCDV